MKLLKKTLNYSLKLIFGVKESAGLDLGIPDSILVVRQHNQLGDVIVSTPMFRAIKEKYPNSNLTVIVSPQNYKALEKNPFINTLFCYDQHKLKNPAYLKHFRSLLKKEYDITVVPVCTSISFTSDIIARLSNAKIRIGAGSLNGLVNPVKCFFNKHVELDWSNTPNTHAVIRNLSIVTPFGITTENLSPTIFSDETDAATVKSFIDSIPGENNVPVIGLHVGAGKIQNRWHYLKFAELIEKLALKYNAKFYLTCGGEGDKTLIDEITKNTKANISTFTLPGMSLLKSLIDDSSLFITNDTGPMHVAAASDTPVISLFGPTNPNMWAPLGKNKTFIWKGDDIENISVDDVLEATQQYLG
jgi:ADP-heptose:LPS heptosyltransferase